MRVRFFGGPMDGEEREEVNPAKVIFPKGISLDYVLGCMEGLVEGEPLDIVDHDAYVFDSVAHSYVWRSKK